MNSIKKTISEYVPAFYKTLKFFRDFSEIDLDNMMGTKYYKNSLGFLIGTI